MPILYSLVARGKNVLAEYTTMTGNFPTVTRVLLQKIPEEQDGKRSYQYDKFMFHYMCSGGIIFLSMCEVDSTKTRIAFQFLDEVKNEWRQRYSQKENTAFAFEMQSEFAPILEIQMTHFNDHKANDTIEKLKTQIESVKEVPDILLLVASMTF
jgi:Regulated-SNARE-like domain